MGNEHVIPHDPVPKVRVVARDPKTGKVTVVEHYCGECGRLISNHKHV